MSQSHHTDDHDGPHEGPIKTPKQLVVAVIFAFLVPILAIILMATYVAADKKPGAGLSEVALEEAVSRRIQPVASVEVKDASDVASLKTGEQVFTAQCAACHATGAAGAPKLGDAAAWAPRLGQGFDALLNSALKGKGAMGPQGGGDFSDFEIARAVVHMANQSGGKFAEPKAPAGAAAPAASQEAAPAAAATPAAEPAVAAAPATQTAAAPALYAQACQVCHGAGVAGAPKVGDKAGWAPRLSLGVDGLTASAIKGKGGMPPRGGSSASDADIKAVVQYMVDSVK